MTTMHGSTNGNGTQTHRLTTSSDALDALDRRLHDADSPVEAARAFREVASEVELEATTSRDAFRAGASDRLAPFYGGSRVAAKGVTWTFLENTEPKPPRPQGHHAGDTPEDTTPEIVRLSDVEPETVRWLWPNRIPLGKLTILDGDPGLGKSTLTLDLAARLSNGEKMPDGSRPDTEGAPGTVLLTAEDGLADTIRPRLDAAGADAEYIAALRAVTPDMEDAERRLPTVDDTDDIRAAIRMVDAGLVVVDPLVAYLGSDVNSYRDQDVRKGLAPLAELAEEEGVAVVAIRHLNKSGGDNPLYRGGGSIGLIGAARAGLLVAPDPEDPEEERRVLAPTKANLAEEPPALAFHLETVDSVARIVWDGETGQNARDLLDTPSSEARTKQEEATHVLREELKDGPQPVEQLKRLADQLGISFKTFRRAKDRMGVRAEKSGYDGGWKWRLPQDGQGGCPPSEDGDVSIFDNGPTPQGSSSDEEPQDGQTERLSTFGGSNGGECRECGSTDVGPGATICGSCRRAGS